MISTKEVVTTAHCALKNSIQDLSAVLGYHNLSDKFENHRISVKVKSRRIHNDWRKISNHSCDADIAVLELKDEIQFGKYIQPICLIDPLTDIASITDAVIVGFKVTERNDMEEIQRVLDTPIISNIQCLRKGIYFGLVSKRTICAGRADGTGACNGDGGAGLIVVKNGVHYLRGIAAASLADPITSCDFTKYTILTDVVKFYDWLTSYD